MIKDKINVLLSDLLDKGGFFLITCFDDKTQEIYCTIRNVLQYLGVKGYLIGGESSKIRLPLMLVFEDSNNKVTIGSLLNEFRRCVTSDRIRLSGDDVKIEEIVFLRVRKDLEGSASLPYRSDLHSLHGENDRVCLVGRYEFFDYDMLNSTISAVSKMVGKDVGDFEIDYKLEYKKGSAMACANYEKAMLYY